ncbi:glycine reductase [Hespellia stercorisuis DSM 15480]|uniref:Glycine reductase n=2 Tax=Hespellia stercorisuis TaxID=180311 RepID=A0A1M6RUN2_9FIRM|nr:glycine reductase [Hespellia stercorisuis DSM 15480]
MKKAIVYVNQFFGQIGGEDKAGAEPEIHEGQIGPAMQFAKELDDTEVTHTIICGDNYMGSNTEEAVATILGMLEGKEMDIFLAGPAFQAGRYGVACGTICKAVKEKFGVPVVTSINEENPGAEMFKKDMYILRGGNIASKMKKDVKAMAVVANKLLKGEAVGSADEDGYFARGIRHQVWLEDGKPASERMIDMLVKKLNGEPFQTELPIPKLDRVPIAPAIKDLSKAKIALLNTGGIVPVDNPDRIQSASATRWGKYDISGTEALKGGEYKTIHAGFDPAAADADPNVITPVDALKVLEKEGVIGSLHSYFYTTVGTGTTEAEAARMAREIIPLLQEDHVDGVIMVST